MAGLLGRHGQGQQTKPHLKDLFNKTICIYYFLYTLKWTQLIYFLNIEANV